MLKQGFLLPPSENEGKLDAVIPWLCDTLRRAGKGGKDWQELIPGILQTVTAAVEWELKKKEPNSFEAFLLATEMLRCCSDTLLLLENARQDILRILVLLCRVGVDPTSQRQHAGQHLLLQHVIVLIGLFEPESMHSRLLLQVLLCYSPTLWTPPQQAKGEPSSHSEDSTAGRLGLVVGWMTRALQCTESVEGKDCRSALAARRVLLASFLDWLLVLFANCDAAIIRASSGVFLALLLPIRHYCPSTLIGSLSRITTALTELAA